VLQPHEVLRVYKLRTQTSGVRSDNGRRVMITIPADALLEVTSENAADRTMDVIWNDLLIRMFAIDLQQRGHVVKRGARKASTSE
jgi:hypothetical protein